MGSALARAHPGSSLLLDIDDDDEQLSRAFISDSLWNRIRINRLRQLHPARIRATRRKALRRADGVTVASHAVSEQIGLSGVDELLIPHPRSITRTSRHRLPYAGGKKHVGFFGTIRSHKGIGNIEQLLKADPSVVLHIFAGTGSGSLAVFNDQVVEHPGDEPWGTLFDSVDLVMLPQDRSKGGDVQLPAKLIDAMRYGVPVMASPTRGIQEVAGDSALYVEDWSDAIEVATVLESCLKQGDFLGSTARSRFENRLSLESRARAFRDFLGTVSHGSRQG
jgi:glycosyltransferase involved in cell wall biosynthesis